MIRVLIVDDSPTARQFLIHILENDPKLCVVGVARDGLEALTLALRLRPDVITMDIHMPRMDGFTATQRIMQQAPTRIVIVSTESENLDTAFNAIRAGALAVIAKPSGPGSPNYQAQHEKLLTTVKLMSDVKVVKRWVTGFLEPPRPVSRQSVAAVETSVIAIAASTGGPAALYQILCELPPDLALPVLVVQHIATGFGRGLVNWLDQASHLLVKIPQKGERLRAGHVLVAPDDHHMVVRPDGRVWLRPRQAGDSVCPLADYMFESLAEVYGPKTLAVIMTGMGRDGVKGLVRLKATGATILAQDERSSVVFGMPKEAIEAGIVDRVVSLDDMAATIVAMIQ